MIIGYTKKDMRNEELDMLNKCIALNKNYVKAYYRRGEIHTSMGNHDLAVRDFQRVYYLDQSTNFWHNTYRLS